MLCLALQGVNVTALREVKLLRELRSPYLVRLLDVLPQKRGINLVRSQPTAWPRAALSVPCNSGSTAAKKTTFSALQLAKHDLLRLHTVARL